jgi:Protein DA1/LIM domain
LNRKTLHGSYGHLNGNDMQYRSQYNTSASNNRQYRRNSLQQQTTTSDPFDYTASNGTVGHSFRTQCNTTAANRDTTPSMSRNFIPTRSVSPRRSIVPSKSESHPSSFAQYKNAMIAASINTVDRIRIRPAETATMPTTTEENDLALARRMQDLEDRGLGQQNSDRELDVFINTSSNIMNDIDLKGSVSDNRARDNFESLAKILSESGTDVNELSVDVINELLGSHSSLVRTVHETTTTTNQPNNRLIVDNRNTILPKSRPTSPIKSSILVVSNDFDDSISEITNPIDHPNKNNKGKRRGLFGFVLADKSRNNLEEITKDAPTTTLFVPHPPAPAPIPLPTTLLSMEQNIDRKKISSTQPVVTVNVLVGGGSDGVPASIPPPPPPSSGGSSNSSSGNMTQQQQQHRQSRSMSPKPRPTSNIVPSNHLPVVNQTIHRTASGIPCAIPPKPVGMMSISNNPSSYGLYRGTNVCSACGLSHGSFLKVLDRRYHPECFRCTSCNGRIDSNDQFKYTTDDNGRIHPHHRECFLNFGVQCCVCQQKVPVTPDGRVPYIKHPFFSSEVMCVRHADENIRRCCGCQRLEPYDTPFIDLMDGNRCVCTNCCRSVIVDSSEAKPLWNSVLTYLEQKLKLPVWGSMKDIPILIVGEQSLNEQIVSQGSIHGAMSQQILASGLCLTEQGQTRTASTRSISNQRSNTNVIAILCPTGLPRVLVASILAHESIHAWMKCHPNYNIHQTLSLQVEEGLCQLVASLYLSDGVIPNHHHHNTTTNVAVDSSDVSYEKKLRQYYKFCIERDQSDIFGAGYRRAAMAYREIGIEGLLSHVLEYGTLPQSNIDVDNDLAS